MQKPIAIFEYTKPNMRNLIVDVTRGDKHFLVGVTLNYRAGDIEINSVSGLFPKDSIEWLKWIQNGKAVRIDQKEKVQEIIDSQRTTNTVESERIGLNLDDVTKIVKEFENPTIEDEELFRPGDFTPRDKVLARDEYERMVSSGSYQFQEAVQDSMLGLKKLYQSILGKGTRIEDVAGFENAYLFENRMSSMNAGEQHEYFIRYMQPLLREIGKIVKANSRKRRELTDYLMAKHGLENPSLKAPVGQVYLLPWAKIDLTLLPKIKMRDCANFDTASLIHVCSTSKGDVLGRPEVDGPLRGPL